MGATMEPVSLSGSWPSREIASVEKPIWLEASEKFRRSRMCRRELEAQRSTRRQFFDSTSYV